MDGVVPDGSTGADVQSGDSAGGACGVCATGNVCCAAPLPCAGQCVPDCRLGGSCPDTKLACNAKSGVCEPTDGGASLEGGPDGGDGGPPRPDGGAPDGGPPPDGGAPDGGPPPDGGPRDGGGNDGGPPPDGGGSTDGGGSSDGGGTTDAGNCYGTAPVTSAGIAEGKIGTTRYYANYTGNEVALSGGTAIVGNGGVLYTSAGYVKTFEWNSCNATWEELVAQTTEPITGPMDTTPDDVYGSAVALDANSMIVGAPKKDTGGGGSGAILAYSRTGPAASWTQAGSTIYGQNGAGAHFGYSIAISGSTFATGSPYGKDPTSAITYTGILSVYTKGNGGQWQFRTLVPAAEAANQDYFGYSIALSGSWLVGGAPGGFVFPGSGRQGKAWVFTGSGATWTRAAYLLASDGAGGDWFGRSVAIGGNTIVVGAPKADLTGADGGVITDAGAAYVFTYANGAWSQTAKLAASDAAADGYFGLTVAVVSDTRVIVGSSGKLYDFTLSGGTWSHAAGTHSACTRTIGYGLAVAGNLAISSHNTNTGQPAFVFDLASSNTTCIP
jgi:hypothetical protein